MNQPKPLTVSEVAAHVDGRVLGDETLLVNHLADLEGAGAGDLAYVEGEKFFEKARASDATCLLVPADFLSALSNNQPGPTQTLIAVAHPKLAFVLIGK